MYSGEGGGAAFHLIGRPVLAWRCKARRRGWHRLFPGGSARSGSSHQSGRSGLLLAGRRRCGGRAGSARAKCMVADLNCRSKRFNCDQSLDWQEHLVGFHIRLR